MSQIFQKYNWLILAIILPAIIIIISFVFQKPQTASGNILEFDEPEEELILFDAYGIDYENYIVEAGVVQNRQTLSHILGQFSLGNIMVEKIVREMRDFFDPRRIRAGNTFHAYNSPDSLEGLKYFVYDISPLEFLMVDLTDSLSIYRGEKEVINIPKTASGIINSSLWVTMTQNNLNPELAIKMSEILAWEIDFYRIHRGDRFRVVYEERYVGDESVGIGRVDAIYFNHQGRDVYGFRFEKDTVDGYFNPEGDNLRKVFLKAPIKFGRISSGFSSSRLHPVLGVRRPHYGTDYAAPTGTPIYAVGDGVVTEARFTSTNGNYVRIRHNSVYDTQYLHMSGFAQGIRAGKRVKQGDVIGYVGMTGLATGPHVCFRFWKNGQQVNHLREEFPSADPLHEDFHEEFHVLRDQWMEVLESIEFNEELPV
jgi:murein DD-endopeptidase MepM/ murein hydrolase activator NlpD